MQNFVVYCSTATSYVYFIVLLSHSACKGSKNICHCQIWNDTRLSWNATEFDNLSLLYVKPTEIWTPDIALYNK